MIITKVKYCVFMIVGCALVAGCARSEGNADEGNSEWITIWNGETFENWRASENADSFQIEDGKIVVDGPRAHLFYEGPVADTDFENFEFRAEVYTYPQANSGIFFHTEYQEEGWPAKGYEAQVNATHSDPRKTGSLYSVNDVMNDAPHEDEEWFTYYIKVDGDHIEFKLDGETVMEFTEPADRDGDIRLSSGTFALQAHDPDSRVYYRNIEVRLLD
jgi:hypothetical protein